MKKFLLLTIFLPIVLFSVDYYNLHIKEGWQLVGFPYEIEDIDDLNSEHIKLIWKYDNKTKKWEGYSNDQNLREKLQDHNISEISAIEEFNGVWIYSDKDWIYSPEKVVYTNAPADEQNKTIELYSGWNLISIPSNSAYSVKLFDGYKVWKYSDQEWQFNQDSELYPAIKDVGSANAVWIYSENNSSIDLSKKAAQMVNFSSLDSLKNYVREMATINMRPYYGCWRVPYLDYTTVDIGVVDDGDTTTGAPTEQENTLTDGSAENTSTTNIQEEGVDEADILKHDGNIVFYIDKSQRTINITTFSKLANNQSSYEQVVPLEEGLYPQEGYFIDDKLILISAVYEPITYEEGGETKPENDIAYDGYYAPYYSSKFQVDFYELTGSKLSHLNNYTIEGNYKTSRVTNHKLYIISDFYASVEVVYEKEYFDDQGKCSDGYGYTTGSDSESSDVSTVNSATDARVAVAPENWEDYRDCYDVRIDEDGNTYRYNYEKYTIVSEALLPALDDGNNSTLFITPQKFYTSEKLNQSPQITSVTQFDINATNLQDNVSILGYVNTTYASQNNIYLTSNQYPLYYNYDSYKDKIALYKIGLEGELDYKSMGFVDGRVLNQFSLSEYNNTLRIATTEGYSWGSAGTNNGVYNLQEGNGSLNIIGRLENLGHASEEIYAVRFLGKRGYVVTFRQTDPFYTLDLSDPFNPVKVGELMIEGVSTYLHPISDELILSVGNNSANQFKLDLYNIADFAAPQLADQIIIEDIGYSDDHKSYTFRDELFSLPLYNWNYHEDAYGYLFEIDTVNSLLSTKQMDLISKSDYNTRSLIFDYNGTSYITYFNSDANRSDTFVIKP